MPSRPDDQPRPDGPISRAERQRRTRAALVDSARRTFATEGFHGASLDTIAYNAGLSKGAVYSNFDSKADLFLAVMDDDLASLDPATLDPVGRLEFVSSRETGRGQGAPPDDEVRRGFALATLEFSAMAGRDPQLARALAERVAGLLAAFRPVVERHRAADDSLDGDLLAAMLIAYEQGAALLALSGGLAVEPDVIRRGLLRLLTPAAGEDQTGA